jgi:16S rRNA U1498 N3-methylase RsmE
MRLYVDQPLRSGEDLTLPPGASRHAQVRRVQPGDALVLFDGSARHQSQLMDVKIERTGSFTLYGDPAILE